ncbi:hypothetical protein [Anaerocolumna sp. MB42-C2]|uniref:hypothetical protein n=1 Tax=Anaerocolumna sp. MB42-C2 TaxID=3070997 RepID=UPI0027E04895|nr:hypothetical protein [Anaerocolumna sp. MB42-C2]WMJ87472.1 hypothetical protein RBU59_26110 [Anaerocolumna sp. MB42-C2]
MKSKSLFFISFIIMIIVLILMGINFYVFPFSDMAVRGIGIIILIDLFTLIFSMVRFINSRN